MLTLHFYPWLRWGEYKDVVKEAKSLVIPDYQVKPVPATFLCGRFVAVEEPIFVGDYALMKSMSVEAWKNALLWVFGVIEHPGAVMLVGEMEKIFGKPVVELKPKPFEPIKVVYQNTELW